MTCSLPCARGLYLIDRAPANVDTSCTDGFDLGAITICPTARVSFVVGFSVVWDNWIRWYFRFAPYRDDIKSFSFPDLMFSYGRKESLHIPIYGESSKTYVIGKLFTTPDHICTTTSLLSLCAVVWMPWPLAVSCFLFANAGRYDAIQNLATTAVRFNLKLNLYLRPCWEKIAWNLLPASALDSAFNFASLCAY